MTQLRSHDPRLAKERTVFQPQKSVWGQACDLGVARSPARASAGPSEPGAPGPLSLVLLGPSSENEAHTGGLGTLQSPVESASKLPSFLKGVGFRYLQPKGTPSHVILCRTGVLQTLTGGN